MVAGVSGREPDRSGGAEVGVAQGLAVLGQPGRGGDGAGAGPGQAGHGRVDGEVGQGGQLPHGQQISLVQGAGGQGPGGPPQPPATKPVAAAVDREGCRQGVGAGPQPPREAGGAADAIADPDLPARPG